MADSTVIALLVAGAIVIIGIIAYTMSTSASIPEAVVSVWWSKYSELPKWTSYSFGAAASNSGQIPAICSTSFRLGDGRTALFVGTGAEHTNRALLVGDGPASRNTKPTLIDFTRWTGLDTLINPTAEVYSCCAFDHADSGKDSLIFGRADGIWLATPTGFAGGYPTFKVQKIIDASAGTPLAPIALCVSSVLRGNKTVPERARRAEISSSDLFKIWSSYVIIPSTLRLHEAKSDSLTMLPTHGSISASLNYIDSVNTVLYGNASRFSSERTNAAELIVTANAKLSHYEMCTGESCNLPRAMATSGVEVNRSLLQAQQNLDGLPKGGDATKITPEGHDDTGNSIHVTSRTGAVASEGLGRPSEGFNVYEARKAAANHGRTLNQATRKTVSAPFTPVVIYTTAISPFDCSQLLYGQVVDSLALGQKRLVLFSWPRFQIDSVSLTTSTPEIASASGANPSTQLFGVSATPVTGQDPEVRSTVGAFHLSASNKITGLTASAPDSARILSVEPPLQQTTMFALV